MLATWEDTIDTDDRLIRSSSLSALSLSSFVEVGSSINSRGSSRETLYCTKTNNRLQTERSLQSIQTVIIKSEQISNRRTNLIPTIPTSAMLLAVLAESINTVRMYFDLINGTLIESHMR